MVSELIVLIGFKQRDMDEVWRTLTGCPGGQLFMHTDIALIRRDTAGEVSSEILQQATDRIIDHHKDLAGAFAEALFGPSSMDGCRSLTEAGLDPLFVQDVVQALNLNGNALLVHVAGESFIDSRRYLEILGQLQGDIYCTTVHSQIEEALLKRIASQDPAMRATGVVE